MEATADPRPLALLTPHLSPPPPTLASPIFNPLCALQPASRDAPISFPSSGTSSAVRRASGLRSPPSRYVTTFTSSLSRPRHNSGGCQRVGDPPIIRPISARCQEAEGVAPPSSLSDCRPVPDIAPSRSSHALIASPRRHHPRTTTRAFVVFLQCRRHGPVAALGTFRRAVRSELKWITNRRTDKGE